MLHRPLFAAALAVAAIFASSPTRAGDIPSHDVPGAHDSPIVSRFAGSVLAGYQHEQYDQAMLPLGPSSWKYPEHFKKVETVKGKITRLFYVAPKGKSGLEVFENFRAALTAAGFHIRFACSGDEGPHGCHGMDFSGYVATETVLNAMSNNPLHDSNLMVDTLEPANDNVRSLTAHLDRPQGAVDLSLLVSQSDTYPVGILLQIVEAKPMANGEVSVNAKAIDQGLNRNGHIALYGIHFASDSAALKASSNPTLKQMAAVLAQHPKLKVFIVGHTDDTGSLAHNLTLSQQRAQAVVKALEAHYHVASTRLAAKGMASYAPVASNSSAAGRARNRRVEMVAQ